MGLDLILEFLCGNDDFLIYFLFIIKLIIDGLDLFNYVNDFLGEDKFKVFWIVVEDCYRL